MSKVQQHLLASGKDIPVTRLGALLGLPRSTAYYQPRQRKPRAIDETLAARIRQLHEQEPACGVRGTWSRPRVDHSRSAAQHPDQRWATDLALIHCGRDGWCVFVPVIDCCTREILGHAIERTGRAKTAERALEEALLRRFGTLRSAPPGMLLRHDNSLVFGSRQYRAVVRDYRLQQESKCSGDSHSEGVPEGRAK